MSYGKYDCRIPFQKLIVFMPQTCTLGAKFFFLFLVYEQDKLHGNIYISQYNCHNQ